MKKAGFVIFALVIIALSGYVYWYYYKSYGDGVREGYFQKFSRKGNIFKTYEGEMLLEGFGQRNARRSGPGFSANYFYFSVIDEKVADSLEKCIGKTIRVHYVQYLKSLPWRGENTNALNQEKGQYIVDKVEVISEDQF